MTALGGPQAMLGWIVALVIVICDGMVWSELGAAMPASGGSFGYLREAYGRHTFGRLMGFLFVWQFILSGPLEIASGYIGFASYLGYIWTGLTHSQLLAICAAVGVVNIVLLYRRITSIAKITVALWVGTMITTIVVIVTGLLHFDSPRGLRLSARRVLVLAWLPVRPWRSVAGRRLRLPGLLRRVLHRRRGERSRPRHPAIDRDQHGGGGGRLSGHQPVDHRRRALARVRARGREAERAVRRSRFSWRRSTAPRSPASSR